VPDTELPFNPRYLTVANYGMTRHADIFTSRQLVTLTTLCDLVAEARTAVLRDALEAGMADGDIPLRDGGDGAQAYAEAVETYLAFAVSKVVNSLSSLSRWRPDAGKEGIGELFARHSVSMIWDFAEGNPFKEGPSDVATAAEWISKVLVRLPTKPAGTAIQHDACKTRRDSTGWMLSTDPPYYDNVGYADLSDVFYIWLRRMLAEVYPDLLNTVLTPKAAELIANPFRHGGESGARDFFESGFRHAFELMRIHAPEDLPITMFYADKQSDFGKDGSTGWETMLTAMLDSGWSVTGTWPVRTELGNRTRTLASNALSSSIVLVCRPRTATAAVTDRRGFLNDLRTSLPGALRALQQGLIAPVDLAQATIGPGMGIFTSYAQVLEPDGQAMPVRTALLLINQVLAELLAEQEGEFDTGTRWAIRWFAQYGYSKGPYGAAETLSTALNTSVVRLERLSVVRARAGSVRLLDHHDLHAEPEPTGDAPVPVWTIVLRVLGRLEKAGQHAAGDLLRHFNGSPDAVRDLAYQLYAICERKKWTQAALAFNGLVKAWPDITSRATADPNTDPVIYGRLSPASHGDGSVLAWS
jgi:putative DNA methylase